MLLTDHFVFIHVPKTAGMFVNDGSVQAQGDVRRTKSCNPAGVAGGGSGKPVISAGQPGVLRHRNVCFPQLVVPCTLGVG